MTIGVAGCVAVVDPLFQLLTFQPAGLGSLAVFAMLISTACEGRNRRPALVGVVSAARVGPLYRPSLRHAS